MKQTYPRRVITRAFEPGVPDPLEQPQALFEEAARSGRVTAQHAEPAEAVEDVGDLAGLVELSGDGETLAEQPFGRRVVRKLAGQDAGAVERLARAPTTAEPPPPAPGSPRSATRASAALLRTAQYGQSAALRRKPISARSASSGTAWLHANAAWRFARSASSRAIHSS